MDAFNGIFCDIENSEEVYMPAGYDNFLSNKAITEIENFID